MSATLLEQTRAKHEEIERLQKVIVKDLQQQVQGHKERLYQNHRVKSYVDGIVDTSAALLDIYEDKDTLRKDEIAALGGQAGQNLFASFYDQLKEIREYHRRHPEANTIDNGDITELLIQEEPWIEFSGEEGFGRYLDLHELFNTFVASKFGSHLEYTAYIEQFLVTENIQRRHKFTSEYKEYISAVLLYLSSFLSRTQPLQPTEKLLNKAKEDFSEAWLEGKVPGWEGFTVLQSESLELTQDIINLRDFDTVEELLDKDLVAPQKLKQALTALGLKSGGTPEERAQRLLLTKTTPLSQMDAKHFAKARKSKEKDENSIEEGRQVAETEWLIRRLGESLGSVIQETKAQVEKKAAMTYAELEAERAEAEAQAEAEESEEEESEIYNPLKLPMGYDGKPIPYWLYKLHGLNQEFKCEICGNYSYWGRRAFERHFKEARHQHGMRCLGIPNTKNFNEITVIKDAEVLWEKIKEKQGLNKWRPEVEEEYEDTDGNVYNKKTFTDLKKQGLL